MNNKELVDDLARGVVLEIEEFLELHNSEYRDRDFIVKAISRAYFYLLAQHFLKCDNVFELCDFNEDEKKSIKYTKAEEMLTYIGDELKNVFAELKQLIIKHIEE